MTKTSVVYIFETKKMAESFAKKIKAIPLFVDTIHIRKELVKEINKR